MLTLTHTEWHALIAKIQTTLDQCNALNATRDSAYRYSLKIEDRGEADLLRTEQTKEASEHHSEVKRVLRRKADGALLKVGYKRAGKQVMMIAQHPPKKWEAAWSKGGLTRLLNVLGLAHFIEISNVRVGTTTIGRQNPTMD